MFKAATKRDLHQAECIMRRIYDEDPSYWPYGLDVGSFDGGLYMVKKSSTDDPVGFVGWQRRNESGRDIGYYVIGILPEHRRRGFAKAAVAQIIRKKASEVDEVKAFIMAHNTPSKALAGSLSIPVIEKLANITKEASKGELARRALKGLGSGTLTASLIDLAVNKDKGAIGHYALGNPKADAWTAPDFILNLAAGAAAPFMGGNAGKAMIAGAAAKTIATPAVRRMAERNEIFGDIAGSMDKIAPVEKPETIVRDSIVDSIPRSAWLGAGGVGLGVLGILAYNAKRKADYRQSVLDEKSKGRVRVTLPTKNPGDSETTLEIPMEEVNLSKALRSRIGRDTRRRLYAETKERTKHRKPRNPNKLTDKEKEDIQIEKEHEAISKEASILLLINELRPGINKSAVANIGPTPAPQAAVPSPPQLGQNTAVNQGAPPQAQAIDTSQQSTAANPMIAEAKAETASATQNAAMQVEQATAAAQQEVAAVKQQAQQAAAEQDQRAAVELHKATQEADILKLQLEKEKAIAELEKAKNSEGSNAAASSLGTRLDRLQGRMAKSAVNYTSPEPPAQSTVNKNVHLKGHVMNGLNRTTGSAGISSPAVGLYRTSYGKPLDWLYDTFLGKHLRTPAGQAAPPMSPIAMINSPDRVGVLNQLFGADQQSRLPQTPGPYA